MNRKPGSFSFLEKLRFRVAPPLIYPLIFFFLIFMLASCLSTSVMFKDGQTGVKSAVLVQVFQNAEAAKAGNTNAPGTLTELYRMVDGKEVFLQRSLATQWGIDNLEPGNYRIRIPAVVDNNGNIRETRSGDRVTDFEVRTGQTTVVKVTLKKTPTGLIIAAIVTIVFIVVAIALLMGERNVKLPRPPPIFVPGPHHFPLPVPVIAAHELFIVSAIAAHPVPRAQVPSPRVTSVIPGPGTSVSSGFVTPTLTFSQPLNTQRIGPRTIKMLGSKSGLISGTSVYENGLLRFTPDKSLVPGETVTVSIYAGGVVNLNNKRMTKDFSWIFTVTQ